MKVTSVPSLLTAVLLLGCGGSNPTGDTVGEDGIVPDKVTVDHGHPDGEGGDEAVHGDDLPFDDSGNDDSGKDPGKDPDVPLDGDEAEPDDLATDPGDICEGPQCQPCPDDGLACTETGKNDEGECVTTLLSDFCLVDDQCWFTLQPDPDHPCLFCVPDVDSGAFTPHAGLPCDDGEPCTAGDTCGPNGECLAGGPTDCDDQNACTIDQCQPGLGCVHTPYDSTCNDNDACTYQDTCVNGKCVGLKLPCKDANPCTDDLCLSASGCEFPFNTLSCDDGNECTVADTCTEGECIGQPLDCDDADPCTNDSCNPDFGCINLLHFGSCDDEDACTVNDYCDGSHVCVGYAVECDDVNPCTNDSCETDAGCIFTPNALPCDDGDPCTVGDTCSEGACQGTAKDCEDGNFCTIDTCDSFGCHHQVTTGVCNDYNACTENDDCGSGNCVGVPVDCDDHNTCTTEDCLPEAGCIHTDQPGLCDDGDPCTAGDHCQVGNCAGSPKDCEDGDPCTTDGCGDSGVCFHQQHFGACEDGDLCTEEETCLEGTCKGEPTDCDDDSVCTIDSCNPDWGCVYTAVPGDCDDYSVCTVNDQCEDGICKGIPIVCDDVNLCTNNHCDPLDGCWYEPFAGPCDDGNICTIEDVCEGGNCSGQSVFSDPVSKTAILSFGVSGNPGQGLDIDGDQSTCQPVGSCVQGIDNTLATLAWIFNPELTQAVVAGEFALFLEHDEVDLTGGEYDLNFYYGELAAPGSCNPTASGCHYDVYPAIISGTCQALWGFGNARIEGTQFTAGGEDYEAPFFLVFGDLRMQLTLQMAVLEATISLASGTVSSGQGVLAGAVNRQALVNAVAGAPSELFPPPYTQVILLQYLDLYLMPDVDVDGDGSKESVSLGMPFTLVTGILDGPLN